MKKLLKNKKGFTLIEMLIVVAIIVILVAVSVPAFTANLNSASEATDDANERAAKAAVVAYMIENPSFDTVYYDAVNGKIEDTNSGIAKYGKAGDAKDKILSIINSSGSLTYTWVTPE